MRYREPLTIPIRLDRDPGEAPRSLHEQIAVQVCAAVDQGRLPRGMRLPSTRTLAALLGVSRGVASAAYAELLARGYLEARQGSGSYVCARDRAHRERGGGRRASWAADLPDPSVPADLPDPSVPADLTGTADPADLTGPADRADPGGPIDLEPGQPSPELLPTSAWCAAWRRAASAPPPAELHPLGLPELRTAVARQLLCTLGLPADGHVVVVTGGTAHGLRLVLEALGHDPAEVAMEDPAPPALRRALHGFVGPVPLGDGEAGRGDRGGGGDLGVPAGCRALVVAPDGQPPLARVMPPAGRRDLVAWARRTGGQIIAVVSPAAPRPGVVPPPSLLDPTVREDSTVLVGAVCDQLSPALRLGFAVLPVWLARRVGRLLRGRDETPSSVAQLAAAQLLRDGTVFGLARRHGQLCGYKRRFLEAALAPVRGPVRLGGPETIGAVPLYLPDADQVAAALRANGVRAPTLASYHWSGRPARSGLVVGYGHLPAAALRRAAGVLVEVLGGRVSP